MGRKKKQHIVHRSNKCVELAAISVYHKYVLSYCAFVICLVKAHHQSFHIHRIHRIHLVFMAIICSTPNKGAIFLYSFFFPMLICAGLMGYCWVIGSCLFGENLKIIGALFCLIFRLMLEREKSQFFGGRLMNSVWIFHVFSCEASLKIYEYLKLFS